LPVGTAIRRIGLTAVDRVLFFGAAGCFGIVDRIDEVGFRSDIDLLATACAAAYRGAIGVGDGSIDDVMIVVIAR
jgi:hypothetical protein